MVKARKAKILYEKRCYNESADVTMNRVIAAYAYAVSEENASENIVVTAPTCGSCGVIPAVFYYMQMDRGFPEEEILDALAVAGMIGNVIRTNASISGAECGCQAEIGSACSIAAGGLAEMYHFLSQTDESRFWLQQTMNQMKAEAPDEGGEAYNEWINRISILQAMIDSLE